MRRIDELGMGEAPVVGETYLVPCMNITGIKYPDVFKSQFLEGQSKMTHVPVIGPAHSDPDLPGAGGEKEHIHLDTRFMGPEHLQTWDISESKFHNDFGQPYIPIVPHTPDGYPETFLHPMKCYRETPDHHGTILGGEHYSVLETEMEKHPLKLDKPVCPHRGAPLGGIAPKDGIIHCPLHGLGWCAKTGNLVRKTKKLNDEHECPSQTWLPSRVTREEQKAGCNV